MRTQLFCIVYAFIAMCLAGRLDAGPWPAWRGPQGNGIAKEKDLPLRWSTNHNIRWRIPLPEPGNSTPVMWGNRVFITQAIEMEHLRTVRCFDRREGKLLWEKAAGAPLHERIYSENPPCSSSPAVDGERVVAWFGSAGVFCFDFDGRLQWHRDLGPQSHMWGYASSPVLYRHLCLLNFGPGERSFIIALDTRSGRTVWRLDQPGVPAGTRYEDLGGDPKHADLASLSDIAGSWATPLLLRTRGREELIVPWPLEMVALSPETGARLWSCRGPNIGAYSSAFSGDGLVGLTCSGLRNIAMAIRPGGTGEVTGSHRLWLDSLANSQACIGSGVIFGGHMFLVTMAGFAMCLDVHNGQTIWEERLSGTGARNRCFASPILAGEYIYVPNQNADTFVLRASPKFQCVATNSLGSEPMNASLAVSDGEIFIRTDRALWCIARKRSRQSSPWPITRERR